MSDSRALEASPVPADAAADRARLADPTSEPRTVVSWRPLAAAVVGISLLLSAASLLLPVVVSHPEARGEGSVRQYLWVAQEHNLPTWWAVCLLAWAALLHVVVACLLRSRGLPGATAWVATSVLLGLLSLHELSQLYEKLVLDVADLAGVPERTAEASIAVVAVVALVTVTLLASRHMPRRSAGLLLAAAALLLGSSWGVEVLAGLTLVDEGSGLAFALLVHAQELGEDIGAVLASAAAVASLTWERSARGLHVTPRLRS